MGLLDRFKKDKGGGDDPFSGQDSQQGPPQDPFAQPGGQDPSQQPPGQEGFSGQGMPPPGQQAPQQAPPQEPFGGQQPPQQPPGQGPPPQYDPSNPDMNAAQGIPRPRDPSMREQDQGAGQPAQGAGQQGHVEKDLQLIIAKMDALKSELDSIHQRVQKIESIADEDRAAARQQQRYARW